MPAPVHSTLSRRERQIMDVIFQHGHATAADVRKSLPDPPSYSAVRAMLRILEDKGHLSHEQDGPRYVYRATVPKREARRSALRHLVETFFNGSTEKAVAALIDLETGEMNRDQLDRLARLVEQARSEGR